MDQIATRFIRHENLRLLARTILIAAGSNDDEAFVVSDHLVDSNLAGHDSHGVGVLPAYVRNLGQAVLVPNRHAVLVSENGPIAVFEGGRGYGQVIAREATHWAVDKARRDGVAVLAIRNSHHVGRVGTYGEKIVEAGLIGILFVNVVSDPRLVAPHGGREARLQTNPICVAIPGPSADQPVLLDFATSQIAYNKVRVAFNEGRAAPVGSLIDAQGCPSVDPGVFFPEATGALLPFGEHKGFGLALICELLAGALTGHGIMKPINRQGRGTSNGFFGIVVDPSRFGSDSAFRELVASSISYVKSSPPRSSGETVLTPGDPERIARARRLSTGIPIDARTFDQLLAAGEKHAVERHTLIRIAEGST